MSIHDEVKARCDDGSIGRFEAEYGAGAVTPAERGPGSGRILYVSYEITERLWSDETRWWDVATDCVLFVEGAELRVRRLGHDRDAGPPAAMVRLEPRHPNEPPEIWEMRPLMADPPLRLFGRFVDRDEFVALTWDDRVGVNFGEAMR